MLTEKNLETLTTEKYISSHLHYQEDFVTVLKKY